MKTNKTISENVKEKLKMGAFSTRTILFDPFNCYYEVITPNAKEKEKNLKLGGKHMGMCCFH
jgi:hypothetical protein